MNQGMITGKSYFLEFINFVNKEDKKISMYAHRGRNEDFGSRSAPIILDGVEYFYNGGQGVARMRYAHKFVDFKDRLTETAAREYCRYLKSINLELSQNNFIWENDLTESGEQYVQCWMSIEKMSKSKFNVDNPDEVVEEYGADTFRMYEMFLGPVEQSKPWDTKGIEGVHRFLRKFWRLYVDEVKGLIVTNDANTSRTKGIAQNHKKD